MSISLLALVIGFFADLVFGDPRWLPHPIRLIGTFIQKMEDILRRLFPENPKGEYQAGILLCVAVVGASTLVPLGILVAAHLINPLLRLVIESFMCYQIFATKALRDESMKVYEALERQDIGAARKELSMIVGRDTQNLDMPQISKAAVETVAENTSDGVVAPMIFMILGGAVLGFFYKAVNTLDSMVGYKNEKYLHLGRFSAKADDVLNLIPARISAYLMIAASFCLGLDYKNAYSIYQRDRYNHASPNSAHTEAVCAGALGVQLAGNAYYFGKLLEKPTIGDSKRTILTTDIPLAGSLLYMTATLSLIGFAGLKLLFILI